MKRLLQEPLLHFALIGVALFLLYWIVSPEQESENQILIDDSDINEIVSKFELQWNRPPNAQELSGLMGEMIQQEVFYQEGLRLNLDHNDEIIKRRLSQKMQFLSNDLADMVQPSEDELQLHLDNNSEKFQTPAFYSFYQIYFSLDSGEDPKERARFVLDASNGKSFSEMRTEGDPIALKYYYEKITDFNLRRQLGTEFLISMQQLQTGSWVGPISSGYGYHLVYLEDVVAPKTPPLDEVREEVLADLNYVRQGELKASIFKELLSQYELVFDFQAEELSGVEEIIRNDLQE
ncbi:peptidyl-prolyl cis-trans isomerase [Aureitalea marina]|uniref:peptidylprolyl isomerase n=1 Tax=Aureitalea marina TaxID=930804 RepID=A0A2S7KRY2_9FLAO|nr:peptidylprolyl isomerase [Aureitalea marina]PQB05384.1 hypothetical protein BST85_11160 [Aureitalea marina]